MANPVVAYAGGHHFAPNEVLRLSCVCSRMILWVESGEGSIMVDGEEVTVSPRAFYILPWKHSIEYRAAPQDPMALMGVHLVPDYRGSGPPSFEGRLLFDDPEPLGRFDAPISDLAGVQTGHFSAAKGLRLLMDYTLHWWFDPLRSPDVAYALGGLIVSELPRAVRDSKHCIRGRNDPIIRKLEDYIQGHPAERLNLGLLASVAGCSTATLNRTMRNCLGMSAMAWLREKRLLLSRDVLIDTDAPVKRISIECGFGDQYQFSKLFKERFGISPSSFRRRRSTLMPQ